MVLPYKDPLQLSKSALSVDVLSNGRLLLGVGIGANPREFDVMGLDIRYRGRVSDERLDIMSRILDGETVTHHGRFHSFEDVAIGPSFHQQAPDTHLARGPLRQRLGRGRP